MKEKYPEKIGMFLSPENKTHQKISKKTKHSRIFEEGRVLFLDEKSTP